MTTCGCAACVRACESSPGFFAPEEAERAIAAGHGDRLMQVDWGDVRITAPSAEGKKYVTWKRGAAFGRCTFLTPMGLCELHHTDHKPEECRRSLPHSPEWRVLGPMLRLDLRTRWDDHNKRTSC